jgi:heme/copper-type cytochrome/quinol oxidase subunit 2
MHMLLLLLLHCTTPQQPKGDRSVAVGIRVAGEGERKSWLIHSFIYFIVVACICLIFLHFFFQHTFSRKNRNRKWMSEI